MARFINLLLALKRDERAVTTIEYSLIAALIVVVIVAAVTTIGKGITNTLGTIAGQL